MPDSPYVYATGAARPVEPGGTRVRVLRRRKPEDEPDEEPREPGAEDRWRELLATAVDELNEAFREGGAAFRCTLEEDESGLCLHVHRTGGQGPGPSDVEEVLDPADLPRWLARLRTRLGLLVDQKV